MENTEHYKVDGRIDGKWFSNDYVFSSREEAMAYGERGVEEGALEKYRLVPTTAPVNLPSSELPSGS